MSGSVIWTCWIGGGCLLLGGMAFFLWWMVGDRSKGRKRCPKCWYDMRGSPGLTCSECGGTVDGERGLLKTRRSWRVFLVGVFLLFLSGGAGMAPFFRGVNWAPYAPTAYLLYRMPSAKRVGDPVFTEIQRRLGSTVTVDGNRTAIDSPWFRGWRGEWTLRQCRRTLGQSSSRRGCALAFSLLGKLEPSAGPAVPEIIATLKRGDKFLLLPALQVLEPLGADARAATPTLIKILRKSASYRFYALKVLRAIDPDARAAVPVLIELLDEHFTVTRGMEDVQVEVVKILVEINPPPADILPALIRHIHTGTDSSRPAAIAAIGHIGADSEEVEVVLLEILRDEKMRLQPAAKSALNALSYNFDRLSSTLADDLRHGDLDTRRSAVRVLHTLGTVALPALEALKQALCDNDLSVRMTAFRAVGNFEANDGEWEEFLKQAASDEDPVLREEADRMLNFRAMLRGEAYTSEGTSP